MRPFLGRDVPLSEKTGTRQSVPKGRFSHAPMMIEKTVTDSMLETEHRGSFAGDSGKVRLLQFPRLLECEGLLHGVLTRWGGVSKIPFNAMNVSYGVGDDPERVRANLRILQEALGIPSIGVMNQRHGGECLVLAKNVPGEVVFPLPGDALITDRTGLALMVKQADCQAVILFDPHRRVIANVHCGWRGNVHNILGEAVNRMRRAFGTAPEDLLAAIGPSLGPCCGEFIPYREIFPPAFRRFMVRENYFDLWALSRWQLEKAGLKGANIVTAGVCTRCRTALFFSYRGEGITGRFATLVMLETDRPGHHLPEAEKGTGI
ncbi:MAG: laccase domain-containing protein [Deltaproteobacteria bacterium]|nr:laccase domain-containing protein [Deltaproteobacteria bacterium]